MGLFWWKARKRSCESTSGLSAGSVAAVTHGRETLLQAQPANCHVGVGDNALGAAFLFAGMYVLPLS